MVMDDEKHEMWIVCYILLGIVRYFSRIASREKPKGIGNPLFLKSLQKMNTLLLLLVLICLVSVSGQFGVGRKKDKVSF